MQTRNRSILKILSVTLILATVFGALTSHAADSQEVLLDGKRMIHRLELAGTKSKTLYRYEDYETSCQREVPYTEYREECDSRDVQDCQTIPGSESCSSSPSCSDVSREVCNSSGCQSFPTRECTQVESCSTSPSYESCTTRTETVNCRDVPYTAYRTETYSCTQTRAVPIGTELVEELAAEVSVHFRGNLEGITGKDAFVVSVANGVDVSREDVVVALKHSEDTHFLKLKKTFLAKTSLGGKRSLVRAVFQIEAIPLAIAAGVPTKIVDLEADRGSIAVSVTGASLDENVQINLEFLKDRRIGGLVLAHLQNAKTAQLKIATANGGETATLELRRCLKHRPHLIKAKLVRQVPKVMVEGLMNPAALEKVKSTLVSTFEKRVRMNGTRSEHCSKAADGA
jgi:hypothetical protein